MTNSAAAASPPSCSVASSTNFGVESTARQGWERGYAIVIAEDAAASTTAEMRAFAVEKIFPRISRVVKAADVAFASPAKAYS
jgi:nicotinamidase-related amidase